MARGEQSFYIVAGPQFRAVADALRDIDKQFTAELRKAMKKAAQPIVADVRRAARELPAEGRSKPKGLRARLAAGVGVQAGISGNAKLRFTTSMPPGEEMLPRGEDSGIKGWRHPVFGDMNNWVHQDGGSWFRDVIANDRHDLEQDLQDVLDWAVAYVNNAGHV